MYILRYRDEQNYMEARTHWLVWRRAQEGNVHELVAAGILDLDQSARAVSARILKGQRTDVFASQRDYEPIVRLQAKKQQHRFIARPLGKKLTHLLLLPKAAVDDVLEEDTPRILLQPQGGAIEELFLRRFASDFHLPYVAEWAKVVWDACREREFVSELSVWTDERVEAWRHVRAFEIRGITEDDALSLVSHLLATGILVLPEGITEAPSLRDTLQADENGEYRVLDYLQAYAPHLATTVEELAKPSHDLDQPIDPAIATMARTPFPAQAHTAQAILTGLSSQKGVICSSDMGTGKSLLSLAVAHALSKRSSRGCAVLLLVPGITVPKWVRDEIGRTLPGVLTQVFDSWRDLVRYRNESVRRGKKEALEFHLISRDTAKLGMPSAPALVYHKHRVVSNPASYESAPTKGRVLSDVWVCPDCGGVQRKVEKHETLRSCEMDLDTLRETKLGFADLASGWVECVAPKYQSTVFPSSKESTKRPLFLKSVTEYHCTECGRNLMRLLVPEREKVPGLRTRRLSPSRFIARYLKQWYDLVIVDELHQFKNASGQGEAMGDIVGAAKKVLGLTGTLSDGKASSLYHLLWRMAPGAMLSDGMDHRSLNKFVRRYGTMEQKGRFAQDDVKTAGTMSERKVLLNPPKEVPGLSPQLFVQHLADKCVFLELGDLGLPLVELEERPVFVTMEPEHERAYGTFHVELEAEMKRQYALGNTKAFSPFIPAVVHAANQPYRSQTVWLSEDDAVEFSATQLESAWTPKERQLVCDVQAELEQGRRCVVYVRYSGDAMQDKRLTKLLQQAGIRAETLSASTAPEDRVAWLEKSIERGVDVVVCNAKLVEVGLDLLSHPSLFFYQFTDEIATMRQAARRAWRIGQHRKCKVFYYLYQGTYEMAQFHRMLAKRSHAMLLEGRLDRSEVAEFTASDAKSASTYAIANCLGDIADLSSKWSAIADKDIPQGVILLAEDRFRDEIGRAMQRLAEETKRIAGVCPTELSPSLAPDDTARLVLVAPKTEVPMEPEVTLGEWKKRLPEKAKKVLKKQGVGDDQLLLFAL